MGVDDRRAAVERFRAACEADPLIVAAFLGGSLAAGTADEVSDLDLYVVTHEQDYATFFARREEFMHSWGEPVFLDTSVNFEGFGFDMIHFVFTDGVTGELALGYEGNFMSTHGGPFETLVDETGLLEGVAFPLYEPSEEERRAAAERALNWFWLDVIELSKQLARDRRYAAQFYLGRLRSHCSGLLEAAEVAAEDVRGRLLETFPRSEPAEIREAAEQLIGVHRELGEATDLPYPERLAQVAEAKLRDATAPK